MQIAASRAKFGRRRPKPRSTGCELEVFESLRVGDSIAVSNHDTGDFWRGSVDLTSPGQGIMWIITSLGERKLVDMSIHTCWRPDEAWKC